MNELSALANSASNFGFPIVVSIYLLMRFEKKIESLSENIRDNTQVTKDLVRVIEGLKK